MYAVGELKAKVLDDSSVKAELHSVRTVEGIRPKIGKDVFSAIPEEIEKLNKRKAKDVINTPVRLGAGVALIIDSSCLRWLPSKLMEKLHNKVGDWKDEGLLGNFRSIRVGGTYLCQDVCAGVPETSDFIAGAFLEAVEVSFYKEDGWARYILPSDVCRYQSEIDEEQKKLWQLVDLEFPCKYEIPLTLLEMDRDTISSPKISGTSCILSGEPIPGSIEILFLV